MKPTLFTCFSLFVLSCLLLPAAVLSAELQAYSDEVGVNFSLPDLKGNTHTLPDYKGKVVLVNFWASWCLPCLREMPSMKRLADSSDEQVFVVLTLNISDSPKRIMEMLKTLRLDFTVLLDHGGKTFAAWHGKVLPTSYLLDHTGTIRYRVVGPTQWDDAEVVLKVKQLIESR